MYWFPVICALRNRKVHLGQCKLSLLTLSHLHSNWQRERCTLDNINWVVLIFSRLCSNEMDGAPLGDIDWVVLILSHLCLILTNKRKGAPRTKINQVVQILSHLCSEGKVHLGQCKLRSTDLESPVLRERKRCILDNVNWWVLIWSHLCSKEEKGAP